MKLQQLSYLSLPILLATSSLSAQEFQKRTYVPVAEMFGEGTVGAKGLEINKLPMIFAGRPDSVNLSDFRMVSLKPQDTAIRDQRQTGLCTAFASIAAMELKIQKDYNRSVDLSELKHWSNYRTYRTEVAVRAATKFEIPEEGAFPFTPSMNAINESVILSRFSPVAGFKPYVTARISQSREIEQEEVFRQLSLGNPVVIGAVVNSSFDSTQARRTGQLSRHGTATDGGHAMLIVGYNYNSDAGTGNYIVKNSWGKDWGDRGYAHLPFDYCGERNDQFDCWFYSIERVELNDQSPADPVASDFRVGSEYQKGNFTELTLRGSESALSKVASVRWDLNSSAPNNVVVLDREESSDQLTLNPRLTTVELSNGGSISGKIDLEGAKLTITLKSGRILREATGASPNSVSPIKVEWCSKWSAGNASEPSFCKRAAHPELWEPTCGVDCSSASGATSISAKDFYIWTQAYAEELPIFVAKTPKMLEAIGIRISRAALPQVTRVQLILNEKETFEVSLTDNGADHHDFVFETLERERKSFGRAVITLANGKVIEVHEGDQTFLTVLPLGN